MLTPLLALLTAGSLLPGQPPSVAQRVAHLHSVTYYHFGTPLPELDLVKFEEDIAHARGIGFNGMWLVVTWRSLSPVALPEPELDETAWAKLDEVIDRLSQAGMSIVFPLGYFGKGWSPAGLPEERLTEWMLDDTVWGAFEEHVLQLAQRYADRPNILWMFYTESFQAPFSAYQSMERAKASFRDYCRSRNPDLTHWNRRWGSDYASFDEIDMDGGRAPQGAARWEDHWQWVCSVLRDRYGSLTREMKNQAGVQGPIGFHDNAMITLDWAKGDTPVPEDNPYDFLSFTAYGGRPVEPRLQEIEEAYRRFRALYPEIPLLIGETGVPTLVEDEEAQAEYLGAMARFARDRSLGMNIWMWQDFEGSSEDQRSFGLLRLDGSEKPVVEMLRRIFADGNAARPQQSIPQDEFLWGFCQPMDGRRGDVFPLSREELKQLRDELHINALRFWVHPAWAGLPQKSFNGPEAVDYTQFSEEDYVWRDPSPAVDSLDEVLDILYELGIHPILMVWPVNEYVQYLPLRDLTRLNDAQRNLDYTGIDPLEQVRVLSVMLARHVHGAYGDDFSLIYTEECGGTELGAPRRAGEQERWAAIYQAIKAVAPDARVYSPELCIGMWWWGAARPAYDRLGHSVLPTDVEYTDTWPPADRIEHFRDVFDDVAISYFGLNPTNVEQKDVAPDRTLLQVATDAVLWTGRANIRPKRWLWAEAPWGARIAPMAHERIHYRLLLHRDYAALLFGMDHCRGALLWQAKDIYDQPGAGIFTKQGEPGPGVDRPLLQAVAEVVRANAAFFAADHQTLNPDGFPVAEEAFLEEDPYVLTRLLDRHLLIFSEAPTMTQVTLTGTGGRGLRELPTGAGYSRKWTLTLTPGEDDTLVVSQIRPGVLYLLEVVD